MKKQFFHILVTYVFIFLIYLETKSYALCGLLLIWFIAYKATIKQILITQDMLLTLIKQNSKNIDVITLEVIDTMESIKKKYNKLNNVSRN